MKHIVLIGDSVTDCDRLTMPPYGFGYVARIAAHLSDKYQITNMGTSGNRLVDLDERWQRDVIGNKPDILSIAIGVNDTWRRYDSNDPTSLEDFESRYRKLLTLTKEGVAPKFVLCEPFMLPATPEMILWREDLNPKIQAVHKLANEFDAVVVHFDQMFTAALGSHTVAELAPDGIHPLDQGHEMMAKLWIDSVLDSPLRHSL